MINNKAKTQYYKHSVLLLSALSGALLIAGCQPPAPTDKRPAADSPAPANSEIIIETDTVTMSPDHILSIKPSRYQPSLGLQGDIEAIKQARFKSVQALTVQQVLVEEGQWVNAGTPLLIVRRQNPVATSKAENNANNKSAEQTKDIKSNNAITVNNQPVVINDKNNNSVNATKDVTSNTPSNINAATQAAEPKTITVELITIKAPFTGRVDQLSVKTAQQIDANTPLLRVSDDNALQFVATLPIQAESQLSVGQTVNFTRKGLSDKFTGQVSELLAGSSPNKLMVYVHIIDNDASRGRLAPNMAVTGRVDYGQIEVGTIVPQSAIHDADLSALKVAPYQPVMTLTANVWIIQQDQRLTRQPVEVIEYNPTTDRYLIAGINNDSLICLAKLPLNSAGKKVIIS